MTPIPDQIDLEEYVRTGSRPALGRLVERHIDFVYGIARRQVGDAHLAEDVTQAVFLVLSRKARRIEPARLVGWLFTTTRNVAANALRTAHRRRHHEQRVASHTPEHVMPPDSTNIEHLQHHLQSALAAVREADRSVILMRYMQGMDIPHIAQATGSTEGAIRKRLERTLHKLRRFLTGRGVVLESAIICGALGGIPESAPAGLSTTIVSGTVASSITALANATLWASAWVQFKIAAGIVLGLGIGAAAWIAFMQPAAIVQAPSSPSTRPTMPESVVYNGTVLDPDGKPLAGVRVRSELNSSNPSKIKPIEAEAITDAQGKYKLAPVFTFYQPNYAAGDEWFTRMLTFDHPNFAIAWKEARPEEDLNDPEIEKTVQLEPSSQICVIVTDADGKPVAGANVGLYLQHMPRDLPGDRSYGYYSLPRNTDTIKSDAQGMAIINRVPPLARAHVSVNHPDYAQYMSRDGYRSDYFPVRPEGAPFSAKLQPGGRVRISALRDGKPGLQYAQLVIIPRTPRQRNSSPVATFDADGAYVLSGLWPDEYYISMVPIADDRKDGIWSPMSGVKVVAGQTTQVSSTWTSGQALNGRVIDERTRIPVADAFVTATLLDGDRRVGSISIRTDDSGRFSRRLWPGSYLVDFTSYPQGEYREIQKSVTLAPDAPTDMGDMAVIDRKMARGRLLDASGKPVAGRVIATFDRRATSPDGTFAVPLRSARSTEVTYGFAMSQDRTQGASFVIDEKFLDPALAAPGAQLPIVRLKATASVTGQIVDKEGKPIDAGVRIGISQDRSAIVFGRPPWGGLTQEGGRFTFNSVPIGLPFKLSAELPGQVLDVKLDNLLPGEPRDLGVVTLDVRPTNDSVRRRGGAVVVEPTPLRDFSATVVGRVVDIAGNPIAGAQVNGNPTRGGMNSQGPDYTDHEGRFFLRKLPMGEQIQVGVYAFGYQRSEPTLVTTIANAPEVEIRLNGNAADLIGKPAPDLAISDWINGQPTTLNDLRGKVVLLHVSTDGYKGYVNSYHYVVAAESQYAPKGLVTLAILRRPQWNVPLQPELAAIKEYAEQMKMPFPFAVDAPTDTIRPDQGEFQGETAARYGVRIGPALVLIDKKGIVRASPLWNDLNEWIEKLLAE